MSRAFAMAFTATAEVIDEFAHVNNAAWVRWIQDIAVAHWHADASPGDALAYAWMITRHEIDYRANIAVGETAHGRTWVETPPRGARFERRVEFRDAGGRLLVDALTTWAMIERASGRPRRVPDAIIRQFLLPAPAGSA